jgi:hypothetical protein
MPRLCDCCGEEIPVGRLKAIPNATKCVKCSSVKKVAGFAMITGKNTYSELQIVSQETADLLNQMQERKGQASVSITKEKKS